MAELVTKEDLKRLPRRSRQGYLTERDFPRESLANKTRWAFVVAYVSFGASICLTTVYFILSLR